MKENKHYIIKNSLGGSFCNKCLNWSSTIDGLEGEECKATKEETKENRKLVSNNNKLK